MVCFNFIFILMYVSKMFFRVYDGYKMVQNNIEWVEKGENFSGIIVYLNNSF